MNKNLRRKCNIQCCSQSNVTWVQWGYLNWIPSGTDVSVSQRMCLNGFWSPDSSSSDTQDINLISPAPCFITISLWTKSHTQMHSYLQIFTSGEKGKDQHWHRYCRSDINMSHNHRNPHLHVETGWLGKWAVLWSVMCCNMFPSTLIWQMTTYFSVIEQS